MRNAFQEIIFELVELFAKEANLFTKLEKTLRIIVDKLFIDYGWITLYEEKEECLRLLSVYPLNKLSKKAIELLDIKIQEYRFPLPKNFSPDIDRYYEGKILFSRNFTDLVKPHISASLAQMAQKIVGVNEFAALMIRSRKKLLGTIEFACSRKGTLPPILKDLDNLARFIGTSLENELLLIENIGLLQKERREKEKLQLLNKILETTAGASQLEKMGKRLVESIHKSLNYYNVSLFIENNGYMRLLAGKGGYIQKIPYDKQFPVSKGIIGKVWTTKKPLYEPNVNKSKVFYPVEYLPRTLSEYAVPLISDDRVFGVLNIEMDRVDGISDDDRNAIQTISEVISRSLHRACLYKEVQKHSVQLEKEVEKRTRELIKKKEELEEMNSAILNILEDLDEARENLEIKNKELENINSELKKLTYSISHDLRAPLQAIEGYVDVVLKEEKLSENLRLYIDRIEDNAKRGAKLIDDLMFYVRFSEKVLNISRCETEKVIENVIEALQKQLREKDAKLVHPHQYPIMETDPLVLYQVFFNLIENSLKYNRKNVKPEIEIGCEESSDHYLFYVKDNGIGFDGKFSGDIFKIFRRFNPDSSDSGTGIGLSVVEMGVKRLGGRVWAESKRRKGSTFYFTLPRKKKWKPN